MSFSDILKDAGWYFQHRDLIGRVLDNADVLALIDAVKELGNGSSAEPGSLHEKLVSAGVDTKKLAEEIHPVGPQPEGPGLGANV